MPTSPRVLALGLPSDMISKLLDFSEAASSHTNALRDACVHAGPGRLLRRKERMVQW